MASNGFVFGHTLMSLSVFKRIIPYGFTETVWGSRMLFVCKNYVSQYEYIFQESDIIVFNVVPLKLYFSR